MAINANGYNATFRDFVDFAKIRDTMGEKTAIARVTTGVNVSEGALAGRTITASSTAFRCASPSACRRSSCRREGERTREPLL